jgi:hypothetical protein
MRVIYAVDPRGSSLLAPITGITSVPSFNKMEGDAQSDFEGMSVPSITSGSGDDIKFF